MFRLKFCTVILCAFLINSVLYAQKNANAKKVLDNTAAVFNNSNGIRATFDIMSYQKGNLQGSNNGTILLKGNKFQVNTPTMICWFNGKTQWTYILHSEEVNIANPSNEELQTINPYIFLNMYKQGFNYQLGKTSKWKGTPIYEVILSAENTRQTLSNAIIYISKSDYRPLMIKLNSKNGGMNLIHIHSFNKKQNLPDSTFSFNKKKYPKAEIIDLR